MHAVDVLGAGLDAHQHHLAALGLHLLGVVGREHDLAGGRTRRGRQAGADDVALGLRVDGRVQQLVERGRVDAGDRLLARDQALARHLDGDADRRLGGALARARLQHPQFAALDGEFEVLHVAVVLFQAIADADEGGERIRHQLLQRRLVGAGVDAGGLGDVLRRADARDDVFALGVDQEFAVKQLLPGRRVAGEGDARGGGVAHVAEHHGLHVDGGAPALGNVVQPPVGDGARVHPARKHRADRPPQLLVRLLRKRLAELLLDLGLVEPDHTAPLIGREFGVELEPEPALLVLEDFFENLVVEAEHDVAVHLDEAAVAVIGKARIAGVLGQRLDRLVVEAEVEHRVHHARHRGAGAGAHRHQQQLCRIAEIAPGDAGDVAERRLNLGLQLRGKRALIGIIGVADVGGDGEARWHRQAEAAHLGEVGALAAEQVAVARPALGSAVAKNVDPFRHCALRVGRTVIKPS